MFCQYIEMKVFQAAVHRPRIDVSKYVFKRIGIQRLSAKHVLSLHFASGLTSLLCSYLAFTHLYYLRGSEDI